MSSNNKTLNKLTNKSKNFVKNVTSKVTSNKVIMVLVGIFMLIVVGMVVYWIYQAYQKSQHGDSQNPILVSGSIDASDPDNSKSWTLPQSSSANSSNMAFTLSYWIYIADWTYRQNKVKALVIKANESGNIADELNAAPGMYLDSFKNNLIVATKVIGKDTPQYCNIANIPIQKWVHVAYVLDNRSVDVYVDCKLERSCILTGVPDLNNAKLHLFPKITSNTDNQTGFLGQMASLRYFSQALRPVDIARLCNGGPHLTKGLPSKKTKKRNPGRNAGCPSKINTDLGKMKSQLKGLIGEVEDAQNSITSPLVKKHFIKLSQDVDGKYNGMYPANFNEYLSKLPIPFYLQRDCNSCADTHKKIIYKRLTPLSNLKRKGGLFNLIHENWDPNIDGNKLNIDFNLYSSIEDAINNVNKWTFYDKRDSTNTVGFPRDASPSTDISMQWQSLSRNNGVKNWKWSLYVNNVKNDDISKTYKVPNSTHNNTETFTNPKIELFKANGEFYTNY